MAGKNWSLMRLVVGPVITATTTRPLAVGQAGVGGIMQVLSALVMTNSEVPSAPQRSCPIQARPLMVALSGPAPTTSMNCEQLPNPVAVAVPGLLKRRISPLAANPTHRSPRGLMASVVGRPGVPGRGPPVPPMTFPALFSLTPPP